MPRQHFYRMCSAQCKIVVRNSKSQFSLGLQLKFSSQSHGCSYSVTVDWDCGPKALLLAERATDLAHAGTQMPTSPLSGLSILVVEGDNGKASDLRTALIKLGAKVHVVANANTGLMISTRKRIHGAILDCVGNGISLPLCTQLAKNTVPFMFIDGAADRGADEAATCMADLISVETHRSPAERRRNLFGSGDDRHLSLL